MNIAGCFSSCWHTVWALSLRNSSCSNTAKVSMDWPYPGPGHSTASSAWHSPVSTPAEIVNAAFEPARTPSDWLRRDPAAVDAFLADPLFFGSLQPAANESFFAAAPQLADPVRLH